jgi:hypothetical protein
LEVFGSGRLVSRMTAIESRHGDPSLGYGR